MYHHVPYHTLKPRRLCHTEHITTGISDFPNPQIPPMHRARLPKRDWGESPAIFDAANIPDVTRQVSSDGKVVGEPATPNRARL